MGSKRRDHSQSPKKKRKMNEVSTAESPSSEKRKERTTSKRHSSEHRQKRKDADTSDHHKVQDSSSPIGATGNISEIAAGQAEKLRLVRFYKYHCPKKSSSEIDQIFAKYYSQPSSSQQKDINDTEPPPSWDDLWMTLHTRYGPEPPSEDRQKEIRDNRNFYRMKAFYDHYLPGQRSDEELKSVLLRYESAEGGVAHMWTLLTQKYGPEPPRSKYIAGLGEISTSSPKGQQDDHEVEMESQKDRLRRFMRMYDLDRSTEADLEQLVHQYVDIYTKKKVLRGEDNMTREVIFSNACKIMWEDLRRKYGPEPEYHDTKNNNLHQGDNDPNAVKSELRRYYSFYNVKKTEAEIVKAIEMYALSDGGFRRMWNTLEKKYGPRPKFGNAQERLHRTSEMLWMTEADKMEMRKCREFYDKYCPEKTDEDIIVTLRRFSQIPNGYGGLWERLREKYSVRLDDDGQEQWYGSGKTEQAFRVGEHGVSTDAQKKRLRRFYSIYAPQKTEQDIIEVLKKYSGAPGGYEQMWVTLERKYGPEMRQHSVNVTNIKDNERPASPHPTSRTHHGFPDHEAMRLPWGNSSETQATPRHEYSGGSNHYDDEAFSEGAGDMDEDVLKPGAVRVDLVVNGISPSVYSNGRFSTTEKRSQFMMALEEDFSANTKLPIRVINCLRLESVASGGHGNTVRVSFDVDLSFPIHQQHHGALAAASPDAFADHLVRLVHRGSFPMAFTKAAYHKLFQGNPSTIFSASATVMAAAK